ncbi:MAG: hypothetical protein EP297_05465 [Gammaproteobacteria bacterium]|nr:MAG: hypothetical protein EP297_05465 [Gammaproteobacteria bacterium]
MPNLWSIEDTGRLMSPASIIDSGQFQPTQVSVRITDNRNRVFECRKSLRLLTGRRMTCLATSERKQFVVKIFPKRPRSLEEYDKEVRGYELLADAHIDIPPRGYYGQADPDVKIIVNGYLSRWRSLSEVFAHAPFTRTSKSILNQLIMVVVNLHQNSLIHDDPHLDNFLSKGDKLVVLDAGAVHEVNNEKLLEENFGLFVAQFPLTWRLEQAWIDAYLAGMDRVDDTGLRQRLIEQIKAKQQWRERHVLKKIYRECSAFTVHSTIHGRMIIDRKYESDAFIERLSNPAMLFDDGDVQYLKEGRSSTVGVIKIAGRHYVAKRYNIKNLLHKIKRISQESRASKSWRNAHRLMLRGITTAKPIAMFECRKGRLNGVSVFVMEYVEIVHCIFVISLLGI